MLSWLHRTLRHLYLDGQRVPAGRRHQWERPPVIVSLEELGG